MLLQRGRSGKWSSGTVNSNKNTQKKSYISLIETKSWAMHIVRLQNGLGAGAAAPDT